jgi:S1-C subfamily serine protease
MVDDPQGPTGGPPTPPPTWTPSAASTPFAPPDSQADPRADSRATPQAGSPPGPPRVLPGPPAAWSPPPILPPTLPPIPATGVFGASTTGFAPPSQLPASPPTEALSPPTFGAPSSGPLLAPLPALPTRPLPAPERGPDPISVPRRTLLAVVLVATLVAAVLGASIVVAVDHFTSDTTTGGSSRLAGGALDIQSLLRKAQPSVVSIQTGESSSTGVFGSAGSGVIISEDGLVLTNAHVVSSATSMEVMLSDGRSMPATLVGSLPDDDIALIQVTGASGLTPAELGISRDVRVGDDVVAIGNALNLGGPPSVTEGIISATDRSIQAQDITLDNLIQTDAAINPGNSGGPLLNADGQVVAINTAIIDTAQNIGFAIAIDSIKPLIDEIKGGQATITPDSAFLGVSTKDLSAMTPDVLAQYGVRTSDGAFVVDIQPGSAAGLSGLQLGDVITAIDGQPMSSSADVTAAVREHQAGDKITVTFERDGQVQSLDVVLGSRGSTPPGTDSGD